MADVQTNGRAPVAVAAPPVKVARRDRWHRFHQDRIGAADGNPRKQLSAVIGYLLSSLSRASDSEAARIAREVCSHLLTVIEDLRVGKEAARDDDGGR